MSEYKIYPPIGIARVGNAPSKFYIGPEVYRGLPTNPDGTPFTQADFRDGDGALCRQAALFHVFRGSGVDAEEITLETAGVTAITWTVHLANKKASWYAFATNEGENGYASNHPLRNPSVTDRNSLMLDCGPRNIAGASQGGVHFDLASVPDGYQGANLPTGPLQPTGEAITTLGELRTDAQGRLLVLGGYGISGTTDAVASIGNYANNDNWYDDTSDGPVSAVITFSDGSSITVDAGRVLVGPPSYAPQVPNLVTLWDTIFDTAVRSGHVPAIYQAGFWNKGALGYKPNFQTEILPLLERATLYPWVAAIPPKPHTFDMAMLGTVPAPGSHDQFYGLRTWILDFVRAPTEENVIVNAHGGTMMPYLAGDNCLIQDTLTSKYLRLTDTQYFFLQQWADGFFVNEADATDRPTAITRGVLENCVGGAFSPGIEMTWISRNSAIYHADDPFRINDAMVSTGPLSSGFDPKAMQPGDVTRYMAVPWQADFNECSSQPLDGRVVWWWPAQRPEYVYIPQSLPKGGLLAAVPAPPEETTGQQVAWIGTDFDQMRGDYIMFASDVLMVQYWAGLGFVMEVDSPNGDGKRVYMEVERTLARPFYPPQS